MPLLVIMPIAVGLAFVAVMSVIHDARTRHRVNAATVCGAGDAYLAGEAFGPRELLADAVRHIRVIGSRPAPGPA